MSGFSKKEVKSGSINVVIIAFEKILGFIKQMVFAYYFGAGTGTDMYYLAQNIVAIINTCFNTSVPVSFLSIYINNGMRNKDENEQSRYFSMMIYPFIVIALGLSFLMFLFGCMIKTKNIELSLYIKVLSIIIFLYCISGIFSASLECLESYIPSKTASLFISITTILGIIILANRFGILIAILSSVLGILLHSIYVVMLLRKKRKIKYIKPAFNNDVKKILMLSLPIMLSTSISAVNSFVDKMIANRLDDGAISALNYAHLLSIELLTALIITCVSSILVSRFSENIRNREKESLERNIRNIIQLMQLIILPFGIIFLIFPYEIVSIFFERGAFGKNEVQLTAAAFLGYSFCLLLIPIREVYMRVQYAYKDSKHPMYNSIVCVIFNIVMSYILSVNLGVFGIAIATSLSIGLSALLNYCSVKKYGGININISLIYILKLIATIIILSIVCNIFKNQINTSNLYLLIVTSLSCFAVYMVLLFYLFKRECLNSFEMLQKK